MSTLRPATLLPLLLVTGCTSLATMNGAIPLEPGQKQTTIGVKFQSGGGNLIANTGFTLPSLDYQRRVGVARDVDWGLRVHTGGAMVDVRYRFWQWQGWHWAINPTIGGLPTPRVGTVETRLPLLVEKRLSEAWSVGGGATLVLRDQWTAIDDPALGKGSEHRLDTFAGGNLRAEHRNSRDSFAWALSVDAYSQTARHGNLIVTGGVQFNWRKPRK